MVLVPETLPVAQRHVPRQLRRPDEAGGERVPDVKTSGVRLEIPRVLGDREVVLYGAARVRVSSRDLALRVRGADEEPIAEARRSVTEHEL